MYAPFNIAEKLDSSGITGGSLIKLECLVPEVMCGDFIMQLYKKGYGISREDGMYDVVLGPIKRISTDTALLYYRIVDIKDSVKFKLNGQEFRLREENTGKKGALSALLFIFAGYLLFFVIR